MNCPAWIQKFASASGCYKAIRGIWSSPSQGISRNKVTGTGEEPDVCNLLFGIPNSWPVGSKIHEQWFRSLKNVLHMAINRLGKLYLPYMLMQKKERRLGVEMAARFKMLGFNGSIPVVGLKPSRPSISVVGSSGSYGAILLSVPSLPSPLRQMKNIFREIIGEMEGGTVVLNNSREDSRPLSPLDLVASFEYQLEKCFGCSRELDFQESEATESGPIIHAEAQWPWNLNVLNNQPYIDWHSSKLFQTYIGSLDLAPPENQESLNLDLPDDEELAFAFDHHSLVTSQLPDSYDEDPVKTADEVIREIDLIMGHSDDVVFSPFSDEAAITEFDLPAPTVNVGSAVVPEKDLGNLSLCQLNALLEDFESCVREYSAVLVQELAYREELDFEQEQKDIFIARLDEMHRRLERRRRRSSMPPVNRSRHLDSGTIAIPDDLDSPGAVDGEAEFSMDHIEKKPTEQKQSRPVLQRAQSAAQAAKTILQRQWHRLSRGPDEMSGTDKEPEFDGKSYPSNEPFFREHGMDVGSICPPPTSTIPMHTSRAMTIARLRKWASKKASEALNSKTTGSFRALLRRANKRAETARSGMREARSAVTSPMSSQTDMPILPATLTHSASGHLVGNHGINADDLEYKNLTTTIPYHRSPTLCGPTVEQLELFNEMLLAILTNNPNLTPMLTDYILNVYAPADHTLSRLPI